MRIACALHEHSARRENTVDTMSKSNYIIVRTMMDTLNVTQRYRFHDTWGYMDPVTKRTNGMLGDLLDGISDLGGTALFPSVERVTLYDYSSMITTTKLRFVFRAPPLSYVSNIYYLPFQSMVWLCSGAIVCVACLAIYISYHGTAVCARRRRRRQTTIDGAVATTEASEEELEASNVRGTDIILLGVGAIAQMGSQLEAKFLSSRISTVFFFIFLLFMYTSYTANIVSLLQATTKSIRTLEDLYNSRMSYGVDDTPYNRHYFTNVAGRIQRRIYEQKIVPTNKPDRYMNATYGLSKMRQGTFAFHAELGPTYKVIEQTFYEHEKCGLVEMDFLGLPEPWVVVRKRSPFKELIRIG